MILSSQLETRLQLQDGRLEWAFVDTPQQGKGHVLPQIFAVQRK